MKACTHALLLGGLLIHAVSPVVGCESNTGLARMTGSNMGSAGASSTGAAGAVSTGRDPSCPSSVPTDGAPCKLGPICGYPGNAPHGVCSIIAGCGEAEMSTHDTWFVSQRLGCGVNPSTCPAALSELTPGSPCPGASSLFCSYQEGACGCVPCAGDGGVPNMSMWACRAWGPDQDGCPPDPPLDGDACTMATPYCSYGVPCVFAVGPTVFCQNGYWAPTAAGDCLIPTCGPK